MTSAYLSVVSHDDQLHILGRGLDVAFVLRGGRTGGDRWLTRRERAVNGSGEKREVMAKEMKRDEKAGRRAEEGR